MHYVFFIIRNENFKHKRNTGPFAIHFDSVLKELIGSANLDVLEF